MTRILFITIIAILISFQATKAQTVDKDHHKFQIYCAALYLAQYRMDLSKDTLHFKLDADLIKQVGIFLKDLAKNPQPQQFRHPEVEELGLTVHTDRQNIEAWLELPFVKNFIKKHNLTVSPVFSTGYYSGKNTITLSSKEPLDWHLIANYLQKQFIMDAQFYGIYYQIADNPFWDYYEPKPCADKCPNNFFMYNEGIISYGYSYSGMNTGWRHYGWTVSYNTTEQTFSYTETDLDGIFLPRSVSPED